MREVGPSAAQLALAQRGEFPERAGLRACALLCLCICQGRNLPRGAGVAF